MWILKEREDPGRIFHLTGETGEAKLLRGTKEARSKGNILRKYGAGDKFLGNGFGIPLAAGTLSTIIGDGTGLAGTSSAVLAWMHQYGAKGSHVAEAVHITNAVVGAFSVAFVFRGLIPFHFMLRMRGMVHGHLMVMPVVVAIRRQGLDRHQAAKGGKREKDNDFF